MNSRITCRYSAWPRRYGRQIKRRFRKLARQYHPDVQQGRCRAAQWRGGSAPATVLSGPRSAPPPTRWERGPPPGAHPQRGDFVRRPIWDHRVSPFRTQAVRTQGTDHGQCSDFFEQLGWQAARAHQAGGPSRWRAAGGTSTPASNWTWRMPTTAASHLHLRGAPGRWRPCGCRAAQPK